MIKFKTILCLLCFSFYAQAQGYKVRHYPNGSSNNLGLFINETTPGKYFAGGFLTDQIGNKLCVMELNTTGQIQWIKKYGSNKFLYLNNPIISKWFYKHNNNFYHAGCVRDSVTNKQVGVLLKFNLNGDTLWQKIYRSTDSLEDVIPQQVTASVDGGFLITGFFQHWGSNPSRNLLILKTDASGNELWRKQISKGSPNVQDGKAILQDSASKKIVVVGYQYMGSGFSGDTFTNYTILDSLGNRIMNWAMNRGILVDIIQTKDKKFIACGRKEFPEKNATGDYYNKPFAFKFDINNPYALIWKIDGFDSAMVLNGFNSIIETDEGNIIFGGYTERIEDYFSNALIRLAKFNANGTLIWNNKYEYKANPSSKGNNQSLVCLSKTSDGGMIAAIPSINNDLPNPFFFVKYDADGCDSTLAYCSLLAGEKTVRNEMLTMSVFPNPSNEIINVNFSKPIPIKQCSLKVIDMLGKLQLNLELNSPVQSTQSINIKHLEKGIYFLQVWQNEKLLAAEKIIIE